MADIDVYAGQEEKPLDYLAFKNEGKTVGYSTANEVLALWYNKAMFDAAGLPYPPATLEDAWTWDEFVAVAKQLTIDAKRQTSGRRWFQQGQHRSVWRIC